MRPWTFLITLSVALVVGVAVGVMRMPSILMGVVMERLNDGSANGFRTGPRADQNFRRVVRPSPDLSYSSCVYDLSDGPLRIKVNPWNEYWSLALFASNTDNFWTMNDEDYPEGLELVLHHGDDDVIMAEGIVVESPTSRGIATVRRLAPSEEAFARARAVADGDFCGPYLQTSDGPDE